MDFGEFEHQYLSPKQSQSLHELGLVLLVVSYIGVGWGWALHAVTLSRALYTGAAIVLAAVFAWDNRQKAKKTIQENPYQR